MRPRRAGADPTSLAYGFVVFGVYLATITLNFVLTALGGYLWLGYGVGMQVRRVLVPLLPSELAAATLVLAFSVIYISIGISAFAVLVLALVAFQFLTRALALESEERAEQVETRTTELAALQVGALAALVQTLSLRDKMTARHSAAVARYSRAIALAAGCAPEEQELVHTAGLLHDIGKFIFPDRILFADTRLTDDDWQIVKSHPARAPAWSARSPASARSPDHPQPPRARRRRGLPARPARRGDPAAARASSPSPTPTTS